MPNTGERTERYAEHLRNAIRHITALTPDGYRVRTRLVVDIVPAVIPTLDPDAPLYWAGESEGQEAIS